MQAAKIHNNQNHNNHQSRDMSRIGKSPISLPKGVTIEVSGSNVVKVKGPKGELFQAVDPDIAVKIDNGVITVERPTEQKRHKALHGTYRALINNMVKGVSDGYTAQLELVGVGYRADVAKQALTLSVGYSHPVVVLLPEEIKASAKQDKGQNPIVTLEILTKNCWVWYVPRSALSVSQSLTKEKVSSL
jgi:large subunit ribosomal protein L6